MNKVYRSYSEVKAKPVDWLWYPYIPYGKITLIQGDPGEGKSTFMLNIVALLTKGLDMPDGYSIKVPQTVVYQCSEDNAADTIKPRLVSANADCNKVVYILDENSALTLDDSRIESTIKDTNAKLLILDPIQSFLVQDSDMQQIGRMRRILNKLSRVATKYNCAIVLIGHMNKSGNSTNELYRSIGSIDIAAITRSVLMISSKKSDKKIKCLSQIKSNLAPKGKNIYFFFNENKLIWHSQSNSSKNFDLYDNFRMFMSNGEVLGRDILQKLKQKGFSHRNIYSIKNELQIKSYKRGKNWYWKLPEENKEVTNET